MKQHLTAFCLFIDRYDITKFRSKIPKILRKLFIKFIYFFTLKSVGTLHIPQSSQRTSAENPPHVYTKQGLSNQTTSLSGVLSSGCHSCHSMKLCFLKRTYVIRDLFLELFFLNKKMELSHPKKSEFIYKPLFLYRFWRIQTTRGHVQPFKVHLLFFHQHLIRCSFTGSKSYIQQM